MGEGKIMLDWIEKLPLKQQSVVLSSLREPDFPYCPNLKKISEWMKSVVQKDAGRAGLTANLEKLPEIKEIENELKFCTMNYSSHLLQSLEIIGYKHPNKIKADIARRYYEVLVKSTLHLNPETENELEERLKDRNAGNI